MAWSAARQPRVLASEPLVEATARVAIDATTTRDRAIANAPLARPIEIELHSLVSLSADRSEAARCSGEAQARVLKHLAAHQRNESAAAAIGHYCVLHHSQRAAPTLRSLQSRVEEWQATQDRSVELGIGLTSDPFELQRRRLQVEQSIAQLLQTVDQQHIELAHAIGDPLDTQYEATQDVALAPQAPDVSSLIATALRQRQDFAALRCVRSQIDQLQPAVVRSFLSASSPYLGQSPLAVRWIDHLDIASDRDAELAQRKAQLDRLIDSAARQIEADVRMQFIAVQTLQHRTTLATQQRDAWLARVEQIEQLVQFGRAAPGDYPIAQLEAMQAALDLLRIEGESCGANVQLARLLGAFCY
jgi:hypothetical protein